ncbi:MAG TPA: hypothetical protein VKB35_12030 [Ktedonobacteraceae bacterium]|nr:hypothetical protein [Ktedonobacteraceae bacterium]
MSARESEGLCPSAGGEAGWPPGHSEARRPAQAAKKPRHDLLAHPLF